MQNQYMICSRNGSSPSLLVKRGQITDDERQQGSWSPSTCTMSHKDKTSLYLVCTVAILIQQENNKKPKFQKLKTIIQLHQKFDFAIMTYNRIEIRSKPESWMHIANEYSRGHKRGDGYSSDLPRPMRKEQKVEEHTGSAVIELRKPRKSTELSTPASDLNWGSSPDLLGSIRKSTKNCSQTANRSEGGKPELPGLISSKRCRLQSREAQAAATEHWTEAPQRFRVFAGLSSSLGLTRWPKSPLTVLANINLVNRLPGNFPPLYYYIQILKKFIFS